MSAIKESLYQTIDQRKPVKFAHTLSSHNSNEHLAHLIRRHRQPLVWWGWCPAHLWEIARRLSHKHQITILIRRVSQRAQRRNP